MTTSAITDPVERTIAESLDAAGIRYVRGYGTRDLDFHLPEHDIRIECKQFFTPRVADQLAANHDVILIQGMGAARAFAAMIAGRAD
mgnify:CR=1 FL=1